VTAGLFIHTPKSLELRLNFFLDPRFEVLGAPCLLYNFVIRKPGASLCPGSYSVRQTATTAQCLVSFYSFLTITSFVVFIVRRLMFTNSRQDTHSLYTHPVSFFYPVNYFIVVIPCAFIRYFIVKMISGL